MTAATAAQTWDLPTPSLGVLLADEMRDVARKAEAGRERSQQRALGPSGIGKPCVRCLARHVLGRPVVRQFDDPWLRIIGVAVHSWLEEAELEATKRAGVNLYLQEMRVYPDGPNSELLPKGGNLDLYVISRKTVVDHKTTSLEKLRAYRLNGPGQQYRYQGHLYGRGLRLMGVDVEHVAIAFWPRGGRLSDLWVWTEPYSEQVAVEALDRYRTIRDLALTNGPSILPHLPADESCFDCGGADCTPEELLP